MIGRWHLGTARCPQATGPGTRTAPVVRPRRTVVLLADGWNLKVLVGKSLSYSNPGAESFHTSLRVGVRMPEPRFSGNTHRTPSTPVADGARRA